MERTIDRKGRVTIPKSLRDRLSLDPGASVTMSIEDGRLVIGVEESGSRSLTSLRGCVTAETKRTEAAEIDPIELKDEWTADLPE